MLTVVLGLISATVFGAADFFGGLAAKRATMLAVALGSQAAGIAVLMPLALVLPSHPAGGDVLFGVVAGVCGGLGIALLYHALAIGKMGIVSPVTAVVAAALPVGVAFVRGDRLHPAQIAGMALALVAIVLISFSKEATGEREIATTGVREAIASGMLLGTVLAVLGFVHAAAGFAPLLIARFASVAALAAVAFASRTNVRPVNGTLPKIVATGLLDGGAMALYLLAVRFGQLSVASVLTSLYPGSTVVLAFVVLRERMRAWQYVGMALALAGVALIAL